MKIIKTLPDIFSKNDPYDYLNWLNTNYGIHRATNVFQQQITTPLISHRYSINKI
jgi:hypothetical protein